MRQRAASLSAALSERDVCLISSKFLKSGSQDLLKKETTTFKDRKKKSSFFLLPYSPTIIQLFIFVLVSLPMFFHLFGGDSGNYIDVGFNPRV